MHGGLNANQLRRVRVVLTQVEQALNSAESIMAGPRPGLFRSVTIEKSDSHRSEAEQAITRLRQILRVASDRFEIPCVEDDGAAIARASVTSAWAGVDEIRASHLSGYGQVGTELQSSLDPIVEDLSALLLELARVFDDWPKPT